ncbi:unnamed protein product [Caenorhabditis bovis]|nr:unnamed protein product [Caenorhabditis bovis]
MLLLLRDVQAARIARMVLTAPFINVLYFEFIPYVVVLLTFFMTLYTTIMLISMIENVYHDIYPEAIFVMGQHKWFVTISLYYLLPVTVSLSYIVSKDNLRFMIIQIVCPLFCWKLYQNTYRNGE